MKNEKYPQPEGLVIPSGYVETDSCIMPIYNYGVQPGFTRRIDIIPKLPLQLQEPSDKVSILLRNDGEVVIHAPNPLRFPKDFATALPKAINALFQAGESTSSSL